MPFDAIAMAAVRDELRVTVMGGQIQRILQPSIATIAMQIHAHGTSRWLVASTDPRFARVHLTADRLAKAFPTPSNFVMVLRKYLEGSRVVDIEQTPYERVLRIVCGPEEHRSYLVAEVMGKHSNVVLLDSDDQVLGALKLITSRQSRVRPILPGTLYRLPPPRERDDALFGDGPRLDPALEPEAVFHLIENVPVNTTWRDALLGLLPGASPFLVDQLCRRGTVVPEEPIDRALIGPVVQAGGELFALYASRTWFPTVFAGKQGRLDFAPYPPLGMEDAEQVPSVGEAIERCFGAEESRDVLGSVRKSVANEVQRALRIATRRLESLQEGLTAAEDADAVMQRGQLLLAYQWAAIPGSAVLDIDDLDLQIPLDPAMSAKDNAERLFRRYRKLRDAAHRIPGLMSSADDEVARLQDLAVFVGLAETESSLRELQKQVSNSQPPSAKKKQRARKGPSRFRGHGLRVVMGRNARENEEVTFRIAGRNDLWLHARERTGAHVIIQDPDADLEDAVLAQVAALAAYHSEARSDTAVDVDIASVRDVRKVSGGAPGRVTYRNFRTIRVPPSRDGWETDAG